MDLCFNCHVKKGIKCPNKAEHNLIAIHEPKTYHFGYSCDECHVYPIPHVRYNCTVCDDYDTCRKCYNKKDPSPPHLPNHHMKKKSEAGFLELTNGLMVDGDRKIKPPENFKICGKTHIYGQISCGILVLKLQALVRQDIHGEIEKLLSGIVMDGGEEYRFDLVDLDELLKAKLKIPVHVPVERRNAKETSQERQYEEARIKLTPLHLAIISRSPNSIRVILKHMFLRKTCKLGEDKTDEQIMNSIIETLAEKVEMEFTNPDVCYKIKDVPLHEMNAFHLAAYYQPQAIEIMHKIAKTGISNLLTARMKIPDDNLPASKISEACPDPRDSAAGHNEIGDSVKDEFCVDPVKDPFVEDEWKEIEKVSRLISKETFDHQDLFFALKFPKNAPYLKCLIKLQLLLGRQNFFNKTPLHVIVERVQEDQISTVR